MKFLIIALLFLSFEAQAQIWHTKRILQFDNPVAKEISFSEFVSFSGEVYPDETNRLPSYSDLIPWNPDRAQVNLSIVYPVYESFSGTIPDSSLIMNLSDSIAFSFSLEYMQKKPFVQLSLLPFRINPESGQLERLKNFVIRLQSIAIPTADILREKKSSAPDNSVLSTGKWYKIKLASSGIYKLSYDQINSMSVGNPANVRIFGSGGVVLPEDCRKGEKDDLSPVQIHMVKGSDGIFNSGDFILFYSKGSISWQYDSVLGMFRHQLNPYSDFSYYYVTSGDAPDLPQPESTSPGTPNANSESYDYRAFHESEKENVLLSGKQWFGEFFALVVQYAFAFTVPDLILTEPVKIQTQVMAKALTPSEFQMSYNNSTVSTMVVPASNLSDYTSIFGYTAQQKTQFVAQSNSISLKLKYIKPDGSAKGWLDYILLNGRASLRMPADFFEFRDKKVSSNGNITRFSIADATEKTMVWDISNQNNIRKIPGTLSGTTLSFIVATDSLREFVAFNENASFPTPILQGSGLGIVPNQNLHGPQQPDMVVVVHPDFMDQAERLAAYRRENNGLDVLLVTPEMVYNEFSSGSPDIAAYRNFMKMLYTRAEGDISLLPKYLLLFGDGTFDNKGITESATNFILTYQSDNSLSPTASYVSDDFFGLLDPGESMISGLLDIGVGRLPVGTPQEAKLIVDKILGYESPERMGDWRNTICFIGDDEDSNIHMTDADGLANFVEAKYPGFNLNKIYLDAYKQVTTPVGQEYPDVNRAINDQVERGALIINYTGHGGIKGWAHEQILGVNDIDRWKNDDRMPLFMTATCEFSRYDDHVVISAGEKVLLNPKGGGIALLTTTRLVYSQPNRVLNEKFYEIVFEKDSEGENYSLGDIMRYTKNNAGSGINKRNFTLLGDPSQRLSYPEFFVYADSLNGQLISEATDTLKALSKVSISGHLADLEGNLMTGFSGYVYPTVFDKSVLQETLANDGGTKKTFRLRNNILYKGKSTVTDGVFNFSFLVPKDINYAYGSGRLSFYAHDSLFDASGSYNGIQIGGTSYEANIDIEGPEIDVYMNSPSFRSGGITDENPVLYVEVSDEHGVNTTGNGIGHDITAVLDDRTQNAFFLNEYYQAYLDSYQGGIISYPLNNLEAGHHTIIVKVWDIYNNSSIGTTDFIVMKSDDFILEGLMNFPNPFSDYTNISFGHNKPGVDMEIIVDILNLDGKLVKTIKAFESNTGYRSQNIYWDGSGAQTGQSVYIYRIRVATSEGESAEKSGKLILTR